MTGARLTPSSFYILSLRASQSFLGLSHLFSLMGTGGRRQEKNERRGNIILFENNFKPSKRWIPAYRSVVRLDSGPSCYWENKKGTKEGVITKMTEDWRKRALDKEIAFYEHYDLRVGLVVPCPICGLIMVDCGPETGHELLCPECGILAWNTVRYYGSCVGMLLSVMNAPYNGIWERVRKRGNERVTRPLSKLFCVNVITKPSR